MAVIIQPSAKYGSFLKYIDPIPLMQYCLYKHLVYTECVFIQESRHVSHTRGPFPPFSVLFVCIHIKRSQSLMCVLFTPLVYTGRRCSIVRVSDDNRKTICHRWPIKKKGCRIASMQKHNPFVMVPLFGARTNIYIYVYASKVCCIICRYGLWCFFCCLELLYVYIYICFASRA